MRIIVERDALAEAVAWVARSLPSRPVLPILSGLLLEASPGGLTLSCFDYEVSARIQVDAKVTEAGTALVPGRLLAEITRSLPPLPVEVDHEKDDVTVTCGPASFTLVTLPVKEYPRLPELPRLAGTVDGGVLATAIGQVAPAASRDDTLPVITGVNVEIDDDTIRLVATDRYRLAIRELGWNPSRPGSRGTLLVPAKTLSDAARMMVPGVPVRVMMRGEPGAARPDHRREPGGLAARGRRDDRIRVGRAAADHPADRGGVHQVHVPVPRWFRQPRGHACHPAGRSGQAGGAGRGAGEFGAAVVRPWQGHDRSGHRGASAGAGDGRRGFRRRGDRDRVQPALPDGRARRGPDRGYRRPGRRGQAPGPQRKPEQAGKGQNAEKGPPIPDEARIRLQFTSPTKPALITGSAGDGDESAPDYRYLVVPLRTLAST